MPVECVDDVAVHFLRLRNRCEPELPEAAVGGSGGQRISMRWGEGLEPDAVALEGDGIQCDHDGPRLLLMICSFVLIISSPSVILGLGGSESMFREVLS